MLNEIFEKAIGKAWEKACVFNTSCVIHDAFLLFY